MDAFDLVENSYVCVCIICKLICSRVERLLRQYVMEIVNLIVYLD